VVKDDERNPDMSVREFIALGTSSQAPTRARSHNAYLLRWDGEGFLFDPGEGAQRQLTFAGIAASSIHRILISHFHGDHCLGLAGIVQRLSLDNCDHPVHLHYPESGECYIDRLCNASICQPNIELIRHPIRHEEGIMMELSRTEGYALMAHTLEHSVPTVGFRLQEPSQVRFIPEKLDQAGVHGPMVGELLRKGSIKNGDRTVWLDEVTAKRQGSVFAFVMDTRSCAGAVALAEDADLLLMESTYIAEHKELAALYCHSTAADAAETARAAGVSRLALTHFSQRYSDAGQHLLEAGEIFANVIALNDLDRITIPRRS
jgi:ribonuclease Z